MWAISKEQFKKIEVSIDEQREYRAFKILSKEEKFAKMPKEELKEKIHYYAGFLTDRKMAEVLFIEFIRWCIIEPDIIESATVGGLLMRIENNLR